MFLVVSGTFDQILTYMGFCLGIFPILAVLGVFKIRRRGSGEYRMPGFPLVPLFFAGASLSMLVLAYFGKTRGILGRPPHGGCRNSVLLRSSVEKGEGLRARVRHQKKGPSRASTHGRESLPGA